MRSSIYLSSLICYNFAQDAYPRYRNSLDSGSTCLDKSGLAHRSLGVNIMIILALETSCDETSVAVLRDGQEILSNKIASQVELHKKYGGIVPEIASRKHVEVVNPLIKEAQDEAKVDFKHLNAVAVTYGPGLVGSLMVGICAAKAIAWALNLPLIGVNHLEGHIYANFLTSNFQLPTSKQIPNTKSQSPNFPFICLIVSGGHTMIVLVKEHGIYETLGRTRDDAAGEAFDKVARFLNIGYPGGPIIDKLAKQGDPKAIRFPRPMLEQGYDFSFSGLKTAVVNYVGRQSAAVASGESADVERITIPTTPSIDAKRIADIAASFQQAVVDVLVEKTIRAAKAYNCEWISLAGGVSANSLLRESLKIRAEKEKLKISIPPLILCTDNAAMIACAAYHRLKRKEFSDLKLAAVASLRL